MTVQCSLLDNGLRVVSHQMPSVQTVGVGVWIKAGSRQERPLQNGLAHFLEHMAFKGTERRTAFDIVAEIERVGGDLNAATGIDQTSFYAHGLGSSLEVSVDLLGDILAHPEFNPEDMAREADVIEQEIMASFEQGEEQVFDFALQKSFPAQALGRPVMGQVELVKVLEADDLSAYMMDHYQTGQMVLAAAGAVEHDAFVDLAAKHFGDYRAGSGQALEAAAYQGGVEVMEGRFEQAHVTVGFEGVQLASDDIFAAQILNIVLGGGMSSRLFQEVREKRGLAYHVYGFHTSFEDTGFLGAYAATDPRRVGDVVELILHEMGEVALKGIFASELVGAKAQLKTGVAMGLESPSARAEQMARQLLFWGETFTPEGLIQRIDLVSADDVMALAKRLIGDGRLTLAVCGNGSALHDAARFEGFSF